MNPTFLRQYVHGSSATQGSPIYRHFAVSSTNILTSLRSWDHGEPTQDEMIAEIQDGDLYLVISRGHVGSPRLLRMPENGPGTLIPWAEARPILEAVPDAFVDAVGLLAGIAASEWPEWVPWTRGIMLAAGVSRFSLLVEPARHERAVH